jgi:hypothetical protein
VSYTIEAGAKAGGGKKNLSSYPEFLPSLACAITAHGVDSAHGRGADGWETGMLGMREVQVGMVPAAGQGWEDDSAAAVSERQVPGAVCGDGGR